jgi:hypothetical protein
VVKSGSLSSLRKEVESREPEGHRTQGDFQRLGCRVEEAEQSVGSFRGEYRVYGARALAIGSSRVAARWMQAAGIDAFGGEVHLLELAAPGPQPIGCSWPPSAPGNSSGKASISLLTIATAEGKLRLGTAW